MNSARAESRSARSAQGQTSGGRAEASPTEAEEKPSENRGESQQLVGWSRAEREENRRAEQRLQLAEEEPERPAEIRAAFFPESSDQRRYEQAAYGLEGLPECVARDLSERCRCPPDAGGSDNIGVGDLDNAGWDSA